MRQNSGSSISTISVEDSQYNDMNDFYQYFMNVAILSAKKRKNFKYQAGACIVDQYQHIVGIGHNTGNSRSHASELWSKLKLNTNSYKSKKPEFSKFGIYIHLIKWFIFYSYRIFSLPC